MKKYIIFFGEYYEGGEGGWHNFLGDAETFVEAKKLLYKKFNEHRFEVFRNGNPYWGHIVNTSHYGVVYDAVKDFDNIGKQKELFL